MNFTSDRTAWRSMREWCESDFPNWLFVASLVISRSLKGREIASERVTLLHQLRNVRKR
jgi:hypothetical protein